MLFIFSNLDYDKIMNLHSKFMINTKITNENRRETFVRREEMWDIKEKIMLKCRRQILEKVDFAISLKYKKKTALIKKLLLNCKIKEYYNYLCQWTFIITK